MKQHLLLDILKLKPGKTAEEATAYFDGLKAVFERVGLSREDVPLVALKTLRGNTQADVVNLWASDDAPTSMGAMAADEEYQANVPLRDQIFDLENSTVILTKRS